MSEPVKLRAHNQAHCKDCSLAPLCLPLSLNLEDMDALDEIVKRGRPLKKGEFLFRQGDAFDSVFAVRAGALKTFTLSDAGEEQITGFHLPSELVGLCGQSQSGVSQHQARMREAGIVSTRRDARTIYYSIANADVEALIGFLCTRFGGEDGKAG